MNEKKNILICPLEWGLGHAGRMVPLARHLQESGHNILIGSGDEHLNFFRIEVPGAALINFPGFRIGYSRYLPQYLIILLKSPLLIYHIILEHNRLKRIITDYSVDIVISDNRIGLWNRNIKSVFVTHQIRIPFPEPFRFLEFTGIWLIRSIIKKYSWCFVPDLSGELNVSGRLSHGMSLSENTRFIGILSRFSGHALDEKVNSGKCTVILSGPEPQRSILKQKITKILISDGRSAAILEGKPGKVFSSKTINNIEFYNHLAEKAIIKLLKESQTIISRSGYTTIMELISLGCSALLIPTPGQTEQEYLAESLTKKGWFRSVTQGKLDENLPLPETTTDFPSDILTESTRLLEIALSELLEK